nr:immunoglobulin heavy chain junction region [Mus musculus]MBK4188494.1 immunoglobulin heavy chain junction region [Mus musculus]MBK4188495.1 immunoglobulin heavy chain junction region [Mus musculus]MBK4188496.1 immunoglobulin heavy chain junction region [Mus musculus]MBK4188497.1 immunoglobulin heavy chain junction region [Mus musculus]
CARSLNWDYFDYW